MKPRQKALRIFLSLLLSTGVFFCGWFLGQKFAVNQIGKAIAYRNIGETERLVSTLELFQNDQHEHGVKKLAVLAGASWFSTKYDPYSNHGNNYEGLVSQLEEHCAKYGHLQLDLGPFRICEEEDVYKGL
jgi:hypothetical protein